MTEELLINESEISNTDEIKDGVPSKEELLTLFQENLSELADVKALLKDYFDKLKNSHSRELISGPEVQRLLRISKSTLVRYRKSGVIRCLNINNTYRYFSKDVNKFSIQHSASASICVICVLFC